MTKYTSNTGSDLHFTPADAVNIFKAMYGKLGTNNWKDYGKYVATHNVKGVPTKSGSTKHSLTLYKESGRWIENGKSKGTRTKGHIVDLIEEHYHCDTVEAIRKGYELLGRPQPSHYPATPAPDTPKANVVPIESKEWQVPAPDGLPLPNFSELKQTIDGVVYKHVDHYPFLMADGRLGYFDLRLESNVLSPKGRYEKMGPALCYHKKVDGNQLIPAQWKIGGPDSSQLLLYNTPALLTAKKVMVVEGGKTMRAAQEIYPDWVVTYWAGGRGRLQSHPDSAWEPLKAAEEVCLALDHEPDSDKDDAYIATLLYEKVQVPRVTRMRYPDTFPPAWDLADPLPEGITHQELLDGRTLSVGAEPDDYFPADSSLYELGQMTFSPEDWHFRGFLPRGENILLSGEPGIGKSMTVTDLILALTTGRRFLHWDPQQRRRVVLLDGEMGRRRIANRYALFADPKDFPHDYLRILTNEGLGKRDDPTQINLADEQVQEKIWTYLKHCERAMGGPVEMLVLDNYACLSFGIDENSKEDFDKINQFTIALKNKGIDVLAVHHLGKSGKQRGTSAREDSVGFHFSLSNPDKVNGRTTKARKAALEAEQESRRAEGKEGHMRARWVTEKARDTIEGPYDMNLEVIYDPLRDDFKRLVCTGETGSPVDSRDKEITVAILKAVAESSKPMRQVDIRNACSKLNVPRVTLNRRIEATLKKGYLEKAGYTYKMTKAGADHVEVLEREIAEELVSLSNSPL